MKQEFKGCLIKFNVLDKHMQIISESCKITYNENITYACYENFDFSKYVGCVKSFETKKDGLYADVVLTEKININSVVLRPAFLVNESIVIKNRTVILTDIELIDIGMIKRI